MRWWRLPLLALGLALAIALGAGAASAQCAMCKATLAGSEEGRALQSPLNSAILVLLTAPYLVFGCFVLMALRERALRRVRRAPAQAARPSPLERLPH